MVNKNLYVPAIINFKLGTKINKEVFNAIAKSLGVFINVYFTDIIIKYSLWDHIKDIIKYFKFDTEIIKTINNNSQFFKNQFFLFFNKTTCLNDLFNHLIKSEIRLFFYYPKS